jgi:tetratricopeptide (TPR) repeat protein
MATRAPSTSPNPLQHERTAEACWWQMPIVITAVMAVLVAIDVALIHQCTASTAQPSTAPPTKQETHGPHSPAISGVQGDVNITYGIPAEQYGRLAAELAVTDAALKSFFNILEQQRVAPEDLDSTLRDIAKRYKELQDQLRAFTSDDPEVSALKQEASQALEAGDFARAEQLLNEASAKDLGSARRLQETATNRLLSAATSKSELGGLKLTQLRYADAATYYRQAVELVESLPKGSEVIFATYLNNWAGASMLAGDYHNAATPFMRALAILEQVLGPDHPQVATSLNNLAELYHTQGRDAEAEPLYRRALVISEQALGPDHSAVAIRLNNLAALYGSQGRHAEAEPFHMPALAIREQTLGPDHPAVAISLDNLAALYYRQGRYAEAEPFYMRALAIREQTLGPDHPAVATSLENYAALLRATNRAPEADELEIRAKTIRAK